VSHAVAQCANPGKVAAMRGLGAEVAIHGSNYEAALGWVVAAAALNLNDKLAGKNVVLMMTGGDLSFEHLRSLLAQVPKPVG
jgi:threonine dehydratase